MLPSLPERYGTPIASSQIRIPDPSDAAAVKAAQPIKFIDVNRWGDEEPPRRQDAVNYFPLWESQ